MGPDLLLGSLLRLVFWHKGVTKRSELATPADVHPGMQATLLLLGHKTQISGDFKSHLRSNSLVLNRNWEDVQYRIACIQYINQAFFHGAPFDLYPFGQIGLLDADGCSGGLIY